MEALDLRSILGKRCFFFEGMHVNIALCVKIYCLFSSWNKNQNVKIPAPTTEWGTFWRSCLARFGVDISPSLRSTPSRAGECCTVHCCGFTCGV